MNFTRIYNVTELKVGDKVAIISGDESLNELLGSNINMTTGTITEKNHMSVLVKTDTTSLVVSNILLKIQSLYLITDPIKEMTMAAKPGYANLNRRLRKAEKLNKRYEAIFKQRFDITKEELNTNLKKQKPSKVAQTDKYFTYKCLDMELPYILNGKLINIPAICSFRKTYGKSNILCTITAYYNNQKVAIGEGKAICHPEDEYNEEVGELISSTKALNDITNKLY